MALIKAPKIPPNASRYFNNGITKPQKSAKSSFPDSLLDKVQQQQEAQNAIREITDKGVKDGGKITEALRAYTLPRRNG